MYEWEDGKGLAQLSCLCVVLAGPVAARTAARAPKLISVAVGEFKDSSLAKHLNLQLLQMCKVSLGSP